MLRSPSVQKWSSYASLTRFDKTVAATAVQSSQYNADMQRQMGWDECDPFKYYPERGLYYHEVWPQLFCGSQPQSPADIDQLARLLGGGASVLSLQQDKDLHYWGVDLDALQARAAHKGIGYLRAPVKDFDPDSLRNALPAAVRAIHSELGRGHAVYVHCTAGLGRAPAACIAYLYWFHDFQLDSAYRHVTDIRPCGPKREAVRSATFDLLDGRDRSEFGRLPPESYTELNPGDKANLQARLAAMPA